MIIQQFERYEVWSELGGLRLRESLWDTDDVDVALGAVEHLNKSNLAKGGKRFFVAVARTVREPL